MDEIKQAIQAMMNGESNNFKEMVTSVLDDKVREAIDIKKLEIAGNLFKDESVEEE